MFCINRNGWYHFKLRVPCDLVSVVGRSFIQSPLRTKRRREANRLSLELRERISPQFQRLRVERLSGANDEQLQTLAHELLPLGRTYRATKANENALHLSELIERYLKDRSNSIDQRTVLNMRYSFDLFAWIVGNRPLKEISRLACRECRDKLLELPPRALTYADTLNPDEVVCLGKRPTSPKTVNKTIQFVSALFKWAVEEELIDDNPARGLSVTIKKKASHERKAYQHEDLAMLFSGLPSSDLSPEDYWLPLIGFFTGMRVEEICQLRIQDITHPSGIPCISVSPDAGPLKTVNAERLVPIHSELIKLGLLNYWKSVACSNSDGARLWQNFKQDRYGKFSSAYTKRFGRFKRSAGINDPQLTFHSLRHTFVNDLKQQGESEHVIAQLIGHANSSITMGRYGKDYYVEVLRTAVERLNSPMTTN